MEMVMMMMMKKKNATFLTAVIFCVFRIGLSISPSVEQECSNEFAKVSPCISYATGAMAVPPADCCSAVSDIKKKDPVCLCYIIQQAHDGQATIKQLGIQEAKLLQLPTACKLANASISICPKLLDLPPNSPDAAVFANSSSSPATSNSPTVASPASTNKLKSDGFKHGPEAAGSTAIITAAAGLFFLA